MSRDRVAGMARKKSLVELYGEKKDPKADRLDVRIEPEFLEEFDRAWRKAGFTTRAKALRAAMRMLIEAAKK